MNAAKSLPRISLIFATAACCLAGIGSAAAESMPDTENGRYALSRASDGVIRLDTRTGTVSNCNSSGAGWACYAVPDERAAMDAEIGRLQAENEKLKAQLASRDGTADPKAADGGRKIEIPLPSDQDMDRVMSFMERAWRRLVEIANRMQKDVSGKI
jgi:hypothetical protein